MKSHRGGEGAYLPPELAAVMLASGVSAEEVKLSSPETAILAARDVHKRYGAVVALRGASIDVRPGEIMGLVGDNGAGKSTLIKILSGVVIPTSGSVYVHGKPVTFAGPLEALDQGIETVYQDLALVEPMSALQNVFLGRETLRRSRLARWLRLIDRRSMRAKAAETLAELGARLPSLDEKVQNLSGGQRQAIAIARALLWGRQVVILDEPTAALGVRESAHTLEIVAQLKSRGVTVLVISHNLQHLLGIADRVTVLRLGETIGVREVSKTGSQEIVELITGANLVPDGSQREEA